ncbi:hypothetical protein JB92DRAFT_605726 [Gautieria morchelliformis]|nr:hypothetical protein JB92DRAFT_605726 [Gautieria morchelliformis]
MSPSCMPVTWSLEKPCCIRKQRLAHFFLSFRQVSSTNACTTSSVTPYLRSCSMRSQTSFFTDDWHQDTLSHSYHRHNVCTALDQLLRNLSHSTCNENQCILIYQNSPPNFFQPSATPLPAPLPAIAQPTGKAAMLAPRLKKAPKTFSGDEDEITEFLDVYECCADGVQLHKMEWVKFMFRYIDRAQRLTFEGFDGYAVGGVPWIFPRGPEVYGYVSL